MTGESALDAAPAHILLIEDNEAGRYVLATWLTRAGHTVTQAADGEQGLAALHAAGAPPVEVAIVDVRLPDMSGFEVCERIKDDPRTGGVPVIHVSAAVVSAEDHAEGLRRGADAYLNQPVDPGELLATVTATLRYGRVRRRIEHLAGRLATLNRTTLDVYRAAGFHSFAAAATSGAAALMSAPASAVFLTPQGQPVHSRISGPGGVPGSVPTTADTLNLIARHAVGSGTGATIARLPAARWKALLPQDVIDTDVVVVVARTKPDRPPICLAVPAAAVNGREDEQMLQQLAHACALSLEVLRTYNEEHSLALTLQRTFLPERLPDVAGIDFAFRYLPASARAEIGGDFYEALETRDGILLAIGDVAGHSLAAAVAMGRVRHALHAYALEDHPPHRILDLLETLLAYSQPHLMVTMCLILIEPGGRRVHIANAGHIPPLLLGPGEGQAEYVHEHGPLLGLGLPHPPAAVRDTAPGTRLLLLTDGLVERRDKALDACLADFRAAAAAAPQDPERLCDALLLAFGEDKDDDIALLAVRLD